MIEPTPEEKWRSPTYWREQFDSLYYDLVLLAAGQQPGFWDRLALWTEDDYKACVEDPSYARKMLGVE